MWPASAWEQREGLFAPPKAEKADGWQVPQSGLDLNGALSDDAANYCEAIRYFRAGMGNHTPVGRDLLIQGAFVCSQTCS